MSEKLQYRGYTIDVVRDDLVENPRNWDNLGTLALSASSWADETVACVEDLYALLLDDTDYMKWSNKDQMYSDYTYDHEKAQRCLDQKYIVLPVYKMDHGSVSFSTSTFNCPWDSGQDGFIYVSKERIREEYSVKKISKKIRDIVIKSLEQEVGTFSMAVNGEVYAFCVLDDDDEALDSCCGFVGYDHDASGLMDTVREFVDSMVQRDRRRKMNALKNLINNHVPLIYRQDILDVA